MHETNKYTKKHLPILMSIVAYLACLLLLVVLFIGEDILHLLTSVYPDWVFSGFFIAWFLLVISSVQKLREHQCALRLQRWVLKTTLPIFIFIAPYFNQLLDTPSLGSTATITSLSSDSGLAIYCAYIAIIVLFIVHFMPRMNARRKVVAVNRS